MIVRDLQRLALFQSLDAAALAVLAPVLAAYRYHAGTTLPYPVEAPDALYLVGSGRVRVFRGSAAGEDVTLFYLGAGDCLQFLTRGDAGHIRSTGEVLEEGIIYGVPPGRLRSVARRHPAILEAMNAQLLRLLLDSYDRLTDLALYGLRERLQRILYRLARDIDPPVVVISHEELAALVGARREQVTRMLNDLRRAGVVAYGRGERGIRLLRC